MVRESYEHEDCSSITTTAGRGWEVGSGLSVPSNSQPPPAHASRQEREQRRASRQQQQLLQQPQTPLGHQPVPPSPALVRHGSKTRKIPNALTPGGQGLGFPAARGGTSTPNSAAAHVDVPAQGVNGRRVSTQPTGMPLSSGMHQYGGTAGPEDSVGYGGAGTGVVPATARGEMVGNGDLDDDRPQ